MHPPHLCHPVQEKVFSSPQSEAQELTTVKMSKFGGGIGAPTTEERLKEAADIHLRLGQIQRYCELMVELGEVRDMREFSSGRSWVVGGCEADLSRGLAGPRSLMCLPSQGVLGAGTCWTRISHPKPQSETLGGSQAPELLFCLMYFY